MPFDIAGGLDDGAKVRVASFTFPGVTFQIRTAADGVQWSPYVMGKRYDDTLSHFGQFPVLFERIHQSAAVMFLAPYVPLYDKILMNYPHLDLSIQSHHSSELYGMLSEHNIDIGFVYHQLHYKNIISEKLFEEKLYLVQSEHPTVEKPIVHTDELDPT